MPKKSTKASVRAKAKKQAPKNTQNKDKIKNNNNNNEDENDNVNEIIDENENENENENQNDNNHNDNDNDDEKDDEYVQVDADVESINTVSTHQSNPNNKRQSNNNNNELKNDIPEEDDDEEALNRKELIRKYNVHLGPPNYVPAPIGTPKSVHIESLTMMDPGGGRELLSKTELHIGEGSIYGLVGKNGFGKTTLLKQMANYEIDGFPKHIRMILVNQEEEISSMTCLESVLKADEIRQHLIDEEDRLTTMQETAEDPKAQDEINELLNMIYDLNEEFNYDQSERRAMQILSGLGFTKDMMVKAVKDLSGGWQMRVKLAKALFVEPDLMLLDEPTNHLDFPTVLWLQNYLLGYKKTVIVVSHDRTFLNTVCKYTIHLAQKKLKYFKGNYDTMIKTETFQMVTNMSAYDALQKRVSEIKEWMAKYKDKGEKMAAAIQSKQKVLDQLEQESELIAPAKLEKELTFQFPEIGKLEEYICRMSDVSFKYPNMTDMLLEHIDLQIDCDSRVGMIGANGVGKSTLVKLVMGTLKPISGDCIRNRQAKIALFTQYHMDQLNLEESAVDFLIRRFADDEELKNEKDKSQYVRRRLGRFNLTGNQHTQQMKYLSGGQKSRVAFCVATWSKPHFLIMDEPTNHLDMETIDSLITAIKTFEGGVLVISHDQHFLQHIASQYWAVTSEGIKTFDEFENAKKFALKERLESMGDLKNINMDEFDEKLDNSGNYAKKQKKSKKQIKLDEKIAKAKGDKKKDKKDKKDKKKK